MVTKDRCPKCGLMGTKHYLKRRYEDVTYEKNPIHGFQEYKYLEYIHPSHNNKRKICYIGDFQHERGLIINRIPAQFRVKPNYSDLDFTIFRRLYKKIGSKLLTSGLGSKNFQIILKSIINNYKPYANGKFPKIVKPYKAMKTFFPQHEEEVCRRCGKVGYMHYIWNPKYPYRLYYDIIHNINNIRTRCHGARLWIGDVDVNYEYNILKAMKSLIDDLEDINIKNIKTSILKAEVKKILLKYIAYTEPEYNNA